MPGVLVLGGWRCGTLPRPLNAEGSEAEPPRLPLFHVLDSKPCPADGGFLRGPRRVSV